MRGRLGAFISGGEHAYLYETPRGEVREDRPLLAGPTLVWVGGGRVHRLETAAPRAEALRIARSVGRKGRAGRTKASARRGPAPNARWNGASSGPR